MRRVNFLLFHLCPSQITCTMMCFVPFLLRQVKEQKKLENNPRKGTRIVVNLRPQNKINQGVRGSCSKHAHIDCLSQALSQSVPTFSGVETGCNLLLNKCGQLVVTSWSDVTEVLRLYASSAKKPISTDCHSQPRGQEWGTYPEFWPFLSD